MKQIGQMNVGDCFRRGTHTSVWLVLDVGDTAVYAMNNFGVTHKFMPNVLGTEITSEEFNELENEMIGGKEVKF